MIKKWTASLLVSALLVLSLSSVPSFGLLLISNVSLWNRHRLAQKGLSTTGSYGAPVTLPEYINKTSAKLTQSVILGNGLTVEDQYAEDRTIILVYTDGVWKVDSVSKGTRTLIAGFAPFTP